MDTVPGISRTGKKNEIVFNLDAREKILPGSSQTLQGKSVPFP